MSIAAVPGIGTASLPAPVRTSANAPAQAGGFTGLLDQVQGSLNHADQLGQQLATGQLTDLHELTTATTKAQLGVELTVAVRNRAVEAFQEIMRMQV